MDNRQYKRFDSGNLLSYVCEDKNDKVVQQGMGKTVDVSEGGILLETHVAINVENSILLSIGFGDEMADIRGQVIYSREREDKMIESGIKFFNISEDGKKYSGLLLKNFMADTITNNRFYTEMVTEI